jgi:Zn-dependent protease
MSWTGAYSYSWNPPPPPRRRLTTSKTELLHLGIAYVVLTACLVLVFSGNTYLGGGFALRNLAGISATLVVFAALAALTGFVAHEMAHKVVAQRLGFWAEFRMSPYGLIMAVVTSMLGFIFAAPGATMVGDRGGMDLRSWGRTSLAGPMTNVTFAAIFYGASIVAYLAGSILFVWLLALAFINAWFGTFNLFPFGVLDGHKVYRWDRGIWAGAITITLFATILAALALYYFGSPLLSL